MRFGLAAVVHQPHSAKLEHILAPTALEITVNLFVVERNGVNVDLLPTVLGDKFDDRRELIQLVKTQYVLLQEA